MTPRSIRRAAERKALKEARQAQQSQSAFTPPSASAAPASAPESPSAPYASSEYDDLCWEPEPGGISDAEADAETTAASAARLAANQANSRHSTGPRTPEGKAKVSLNAVKTGLTGCTVLLPSDDAAAYRRHILAFQEQWQPAGPEESSLVQSLADIRWRLNRIPGLEYALYTKGAIEFAGRFHHYPPAQRASLIDLETTLVYEKQLKNLHLQEARLVRRREKEMAELRQMQDQRKTREIAALEKAACRYLVARHFHEPFDPAALGFEFSTAEIERYLNDVPEHKRTAIVNRELENFPRTQQNAA